MAKGFKTYTSFEVVDSVFFFCNQGFVFNTSLDCFQMFGDTDLLCVSCFFIYKRVLILVLSDQPF